MAAPPLSNYHHSSTSICRITINREYNYSIDVINVVGDSFRRKRVRFFRIKLNVSFNRNYQQDYHTVLALLSYSRDPITYYPTIKIQESEIVFHKKAFDKAPLVVRTVVDEFYFFGIPV